MVRVKICGITTAADAQAAVDAGANLLGFNFYPKSPRHIEEDQAAEIRRKLPKRVKAVGIFVNWLPADVIALASSLRLDSVQLHGDEPPETVAEIAPEYDLAFAFLFDAAHTGQYGGSGCATDWDVARRASAKHRIILAGGLKVENVAAAVRIVRPYGIDVASGVESRPGKKDRGLMREFIQAVRRAERK